GEDWHSDLTCDEAPPLGSILHLHTVPPEGGDTLFASMYAAWEALSPRMQALLEGLTAIHDADHVYRPLFPHLHRNYPPSTHPPGCAHPPGHRQEAALRQRLLRHPHRRAGAGRERGGAAFPLRPHPEPQLPGPLPLEPERHRLLGQPLHPAPRHLGLLPADPL